MTCQVSPEASFASRVHEYLKERFPPLAQGVLIVSYYSSNQFIALSLEHPREPVYLSSLSLWGGLLLLCLFFHLRVFDDHKDYEEDCQNYPERVLSRGIVTLRELKMLGGAAIFLEFLIAWSRGANSLTALCLTFAFSLLMLKEFFVRDWLKRHFIAYALSHMCIMPCIALTIYSFVTQKPFWEAPGWYYVYAFVGFFVTLNWEISRKIRSADDEREAVQSYSQIFGAIGAATLVLVIRAIDTGMVFALGYHLGLALPFYLALIGLYIVIFTGYLRFRRIQTRENAKRLETYAGMYIVGFDIILAVSIAGTYGAQWR